MTTLLAIDPGMSSGIFLGSYTEDTPLVRMDWRQVEGGLDAFLPVIQGGDPSLLQCADVIVCEKFSPRPTARQWKLDELEPIRIEGAMRGLAGGRVHWQKPEAMVLRQGRTQTERKRHSDDVLRELGLWLLPMDARAYGMEDANDANAAAKHALSYLRSIRHPPTLASIARVD